MRLESCALQHPRRRQGRAHAPAGRPHGVRGGRCVLPARVHVHRAAAGRWACCDPSRQRRPLQRRPACPPPGNPAPRLPRVHAAPGSQTHGISAHLCVLDSNVAAAVLPAQNIKFESHSLHTTKILTGSTSQAHLYVLGSTVALGLFNGVAFSASYQLVSRFANKNVISLGLGFVGGGIVTLALQLVLGVGRHRSWAREVAMYEAVAGADKNCAPQPSIGALELVRGQRSWPCARLCCARVCVCCVCGGCGLSPAT